MRKMTVAALGALALAGGVFADTLTWIGPTGNSSSPATFTSAANWSSDGTHTSPQPGDTAVFDQAEKIEVYLAAETFDIGADGLTIQINNGEARLGTAAKVFSRVKFTGAGKLVKSGTGALYFQVDTGDWSGGTEILEGTIADSTGSKFTHYGNKDSTIYLKAASDTSYPAVNAGGWQTLQLANPIQVVSPVGGTPRTTFSQFTFSTVSLVAYNGLVSADGDFVVRVGDNTGYMNFGGDISAPGHVMHIFVSGSATYYGYVRLYGNVNAGLEVSRRTTSASYPHARVILHGRSPNFDNALTISSGTNEFNDATAYWGGTNIVINPSGDATGARLKLVSADNISPAATITAKTGGFIEIPSGIAVSVAALNFNGTAMPLGDYTADSLDKAFVQGGGTLRVIGLSVTWTGSGTDATDWNDANNWTPAIVPGVGSTVVFNADTIITTALSFGAGDLVFLVNSGKSVRLNGAISGAVKIVKTGAGGLVFGTNAGTWSGGTEIRNGYIGDNGVKLYGFGTGTVTLKPDANANYPYITSCGWGTLLFSNRVEVVTDPSFTPRTEATMRSFMTTQLLTAKGPISSDGDLVLASRSTGGQAQYQGKISAPGKTVYCYAGGTTDYSYTSLSQEIDANFVADIYPGNTWSEIRLTGYSKNVVNSLTVKSGTLILNSPTAYWGGTNIVINPTGSGTSPLLKVVSAANLNEDAKLTVCTGGKIDIPEGVTLTVKELTLDGAVVPRGKYRKSDFGGALISGDGILRVLYPKRGFAILFR